MANALFDKARQRFLEGQFNWNTDPAYQGTCRSLVLTLGDGSVHTASFDFK